VACLTLEGVPLLGRRCTRIRSSSSLHCLHFRCTEPVPGGEAITGIADGRRESTASAIRSASTSSRSPGWLTVSCPGGGDVAEPPVLLPDTDIRANSNPVPPAA
jgi:hypothetical protein